MDAGFNRRIGQRFATVVENVEWRPRVAPKRRLFRTGPPVVQQVRLLDLSITGAGVVAPSEPPLERGTEVDLRMGGADAVAAIRWQMPTSDASLVRYGIEFLSVDAAFEQLVLDTVNANRPNEINYFWARAD